MQDVYKRQVQVQVGLQGIGFFKTDAHDVACLQDKLNNDHILNGGPLHLSLIHI